jgi:hypothetical protein
MPPKSLFRVDVTGQLLITFCTAKLASTRMVYVNPNLGLLHVKLNIHYDPRRVQTQDLLMKFYVLLGSCPLGRLLLNDNNCRPHASLSGLSPTESTRRCAASVKAAPSFRQHRDSSLHNHCSDYSSTENGGISTAIVAAGIKSASTLRENCRRNALVTSTDEST